MKTIGCDERIDLKISRLDSSKVTLRDVLFMSLDGKHFFWHILAQLGLALFLIGTILGMLITL